MNPMINGAPVDSPGVKEQTDISKKQLREMEKTRFRSVFAVVISIVALVVAVLTLIFTIKAHAAQSVKFFGIPLSTATRVKLEPAIIKAGFIPLHKYISGHPFSAGVLSFSFVQLNPVDLKGNLRYDAYKTTGQLKGAYEFGVGYTLSGRFAVAKYFIHSLYDAGILAMLKDKYGRPYAVVKLSTLTGRSKYTWKEKNGIKIVFREGFSNTILKFINIREYNIRQRQIKEERNNNDKATAKKESRAF